MNQISNLFSGPFLGLMSGTSCDGLDIAACNFVENEEFIEYILLEASTFDYPADLKQKLIHAPYLNGRDLRKLDISFAKFSADCVREFCERFKILPSLISSHGHTVFHCPSEGYTFQIGCGATIAAETGIPTVSDFRQGDVSKGGQGAPLVPAGDLILFNKYFHNLNLGGFANISTRQGNSRTAFDICPFNIVLNRLAELSGKPFDDGGKMASGGRIINSMLEQLNGLDHYKKNGPKSLGAEWVQEKITPLLENFLIQHSTQDVLRTFVDHAAIQIGKILNVNPGDTLITGGGVWNSYALECIREKTGSKLIIPDPMLVNYKEAIIFSLLGYLRIHNRTNVFYQYTGAKKNSITGGIYLS